MGFIKPMTIQRLNVALEERNEKIASGIFDGIPSEFSKLFPGIKSEGLDNAFQWCFEAGLEIGLKAGRIFLELENFSENIVKEHLDITKEQIKMEKEMLNKRCQCQIRL